MRWNWPSRFWWVVLSFVAAALTVSAIGLAYEHRHLGWDEHEATVRAASEVRREFDALSASLDGTAAAVADRPALILRATNDAAAARELFDGLVIPAGRDVSVTVYDANAVPLAWAGRPSDLPRSRLVGSAALLVAPGASGPRLARVLPVTAGGRDGSRRIATVVAEAPLPVIRPDRGIAADTLTWDTSVVPVTLRTAYEGAGEARSADAFFLTDAAGKTLLEGRVPAKGVAAARMTVRGRTIAGVLGVCAVFVLWSAAPLLAWRRAARPAVSLLGGTAAVAACIAAARWIAWVALPRTGLLTPLALTGGDTLATRLWMRSPADFLLTAAGVLCLVALAADCVTRLRLGLWHARVSAGRSPGWAVAFGLAQIAGGLVAAAGLAWYVALGRMLTDSSAIEWLRYSLHPWNGPKTAVAAGLVCWHAAAVWSAVTVLRFVAAWWRTPPRPGWQSVLLACWTLPAVVLLSASRAQAAPQDHRAWALLPPVLLAVALAWALPGLLRWRRRSSRAAAFVALFLAMALPSLAFYPAAFAQADRAKRRLIESELAPQATRQRDDVQSRVRSAMSQVDAIPALGEIVRSQAPAAGGQVPTDAAFLVWAQTDLATYRLTSAIELYGEDGAIASRFALNLPEYTQPQQRWQESGCDWDLFEEVSPFGSEERRLLHAGRAICVEDAGRVRAVGTIVIHAMLDYGTLPFITSQNPYVELFRGPRISEAEATTGSGLDFVVYGWSLRPIYSSGTAAWTLDSGTFRRVYASRSGFWSRQTVAGRSDEVYLVNDRGGIYALGYPAVSAVGHLVYLAEAATLVGVVFVLMSALAGAGFALWGVRGQRGRDLMHEIRSSFYRKLALAFAAVAVIPVVTLAFVARAYMTGRLHADVEDAAVRTTTAAQRFVEDYNRLQERGTGTPVTLDDDVVVGISRIIDQDVNVFDGPRLVATSERDLFASGLLPTRTPADVYRAIVLDRRATYVGEERVGQFSYLVAAAPVRIAGLNALLTVPLTLRQRAIEREIADLDRRILLAALAFILLGLALGYWMAERIADPVSRLQRATARLARGDLDARVAVTSSDELRRLVEAFNGMAADLQRQQAALERTHRLEAWADMARQVAHEIKNPLTPVQLSAEHLRRVHADRGSPLSPVLEECVDSILSQVRLLRQIAAEFSSFASSPTPRPVETNPAALVAEVIEPYRVGLPAGVSLVADVPASLPPVTVDRTLIGRALTNLIENALHAMPHGGSLTITGALTPDTRTLELRIRDTGVGMDRAALGRIFEPYFSTKAVGTGLGLNIAKRNVELHGGSIRVDSAPGEGTTVTVQLPAGPAA